MGVSTPGAHARGGNRMQMRVTPITDRSNFANGGPPECVNRTAEQVSTPDPLCR
jgi:hypothetical protein